MRIELVRIPGLTITAQIIDGTSGVKLDVSGPLSFLVRNSIEKMSKHLCEEKPADVRDGKIIYSLYIPPIPSEAFRRVIEARVKHYVMGKLTPEAATLAVTHRCCCKCVHCSADRRGKGELSTEEWKSVIDQLLEMGTYNITFTGGEPLLREDLEELVSYVDPKKAITQVFTSGWLLSEDRIDSLIDAGLYALQVSIDSPDPREHDSLRGVKGLFERAIEGIRIALEKGLLVGISTYATEDRVWNGKIDRLIELAGNLGVHEVTIFEVVPTGKLLSHEEMMLSEEAQKYLIELHKRVNRTPGRPRIAAMSYVKGPPGYGCFSARTQLHVTPKGEVTPCDFTPISFGNVREEPLKKIWEKMRSHEEWRKPRPRCQMQDPEFRKKYIHAIPDNVELPIRIEKLEEIVGGKLKGYCRGCERV